MLLCGSDIITEAKITIVFPEPTSPTTIRLAAFFSVAKSFCISAMTVCCSNVKVKGKFATNGCMSPVKARMAGKSARFPLNFFM